MKTFPPELVDITLDFLYDDVLALIRCSQVCKAWVPTSRFHLWAMRIVHFTGEVDANTDRLVRLLSNPFSTLAAAVRRVSLGSISQQRDLMLLMDKISPCSSVLQASRSLYLRAIIWKGIDESSRTLFVSKFSSLTELVFSNMKFGTFDDMAGVLAAFPNLQRLYFVRVQWHGGPPHTGSPALQLTFPKLNTLEIDYGCQDVIDWIRLCGENFPRLSTFHMKLSDVVPSSESFSPAFAPSLEHIEIAFYRLYLENLRHFDIDLSQNRALRSIHISHLQLNELGVSGADPLTSRVYVGWVPEVLASVASPCVEKLRLSIWVSAVTDIDLLDWGSLKQVFTRSAFSSLGCLQLDMYGKMYAKADREEVEKWVYNVLSGSKAANLLEFRWH
ncbi:hypothetical protein FB451DRAFT_727396 [Mycena latifolia]|nr:hypothetical protein FB451DRAFT_727396 [Mycena latifolia]